MTFLDIHNLSLCSSYFKIKLLKTFYKIQYYFSTRVLHSSRLVNKINENKCSTTKL